MTVPNRARLIAVVLLIALTAGCGVPSERTPRPVTVADRPPSVTTGTSAASPAPGVPVELLYLIRDADLVAVRRQAERAPTIDQQMQDLLSGPTARERNDGYVSALTGITVADVTVAHDGKVTIDVGDRSDGAGRSDEVLAYGQVVCTLTSRADVDGVVFRHDGQPLKVPRADGSLTDGPLTAADYAPLVAPS
ncbi:GerMN domain-containing protein [Dactylosporangium sp. CA-139114]|uniref:GerMN domain-containing protein n=1 Tax=Dactylosporangium sp. CA-139114 TaxID=3239931 RepID=UPI003D963EEF